MEAVSLIHILTCWEISTSATDLPLKMSNTFEPLEFNVLEKAHVDAKGDDDLLKNAFVDDFLTLPGYKL